MPGQSRTRWSFRPPAMLLCVLFLLFGPSSAPASAQINPGAARYRARALAATPQTSITITTTSDAADGDTASFIALQSRPGADGAISLREAVLASNAITLTGGLTIGFNIPASDAGYDQVSGTWTIAMGAQALPTLTRGNLTIDGTTQPGSASAPQIVLDGYGVYEAAGQSNGFTITSSHNTIRGLTLVNFYDDAVLISGANAANNRVAGCYLGPNALGGPASQPSYFGVELRDGAHDNLIGGSDTASRNLIAGNAHSGVLIQNATTSHNTVAGNWIGTDKRGRAAMGNLVAGVLISGGAHHNTIGGASQGNVISGNDIGVYLDGAIATTVAGNTIGLAADGRARLGNTSGGIFVVRGAHDNQIGGTSAALRNIVAGNGISTSSFGQGIYISDAGTANNTIQGNYIGADSSGVVPVGNYRQGVLIGAGAQGNLIGGTTAGARNVIIYNGLGGVRIDSSSNQVAGNLIGLGADGTTQLGNQFNGIRIGGNFNTIGPFNTIAANQHSGIMLTGSSTTILSNTIELNGRSGICVAGPATTIHDNQIERNGSGSGPWPECAIRGGVVITGTDDTLLLDNSILSNDEAGVTVYGGRGNSILANSISDNSTSGIRLLQGGNNGMPPPQISNVTQMSVGGVACALCRVEIFTDSYDEGRHFAGATIAGSNGAFSLALEPDTLRDPHITATHTDSNGNTSSFAQAVSAPKPSPSPTPSPTPAPASMPPLYLPAFYR